jgi:hypothetical protein
VTTLLLPTARLVACGWLSAAVPGFTAAMVGTALPQDPTKWYQTGFVEVGPVVGGTPDSYVPLNNPVLSIHCWGVNLTLPVAGGAPNVSNKPPWARTAQLAEQIKAAARTVQYTGAARQVAMPTAGYAHASVQAAVLLTEPREILGDIASYAHFSFDMQFSWIPEAS